MSVATSLDSLNQTMSPSTGVPAMVIAALVGPTCRSSASKKVSVEETPVPRAASRGSSLDNATPASVNIAVPVGAP